MSEKIYLRPQLYDLYKCIQEGLDHEQIMKKLILKKGQFTSMIWELKALGLIKEIKVLRYYGITSDAEVEEVDRRSKGKPVFLSESKKQEIVHRYYSEKITRRELALEYGIGSHTVTVILKKAKQMMR